MVRISGHLIELSVTSFWDDGNVVCWKSGWFDSGSFKKINGSSVVRSKFGWFVIPLIGLR